MVDDHFRAKLIGFLQELHAHETEIAHTLQRQIDGAAEVPEVRTRLVQHMAESEVQKTRLADRLAAYDQRPSALRDVAGTLKGNLVGISGALRPDALSQTLRDNYLAEHLEIALYVQLIAAATAFGDAETVHVAETSLQEELEMARWLFDHLPMACYHDLEKGGIVVDDRHREAARHGPKLRVTFEPRAEAPAKAPRRYIL